MINETEFVPEVRRAFLVSGRYDLIVQVAVKDIEHLRNLGFDRFTSKPVVVKIETSIVFDSRAGDELPLPLEGTKLARNSARSQKARRR